MEIVIATPQELEVQEKKELVTKEEKAKPTRHYVPGTDICGSANALAVVMAIDTAKYRRLEPLYTEYPVGDFAQSSAIPRD